MSDSPFPFGGDEPAAFEEEAEAGSNRRVLVLGGLVAALALAGGGFLLLGGGEEPVEEAFTPVKRSPQVAQVAATTKKVATKPKLPVPFEEDLGRDPFRALYVEPVAVSEVAPGDPTLPGGGVPAAPAAPGGVPVSAPGDGVVPEAPTAKEFPLVLQRVYGAGKDQTAEFTIDGRKVLAKVGVRFGPTNEIRLISLQEGPKDGQWTAVLQVGDGEPFDAVTGDRVMVR